MVCLFLSREKQLETVANSLTGGQKAKRPNEFKCNSKLELYMKLHFWPKNLHFFTLHPYNHHFLGSDILNLNYKKWSLCSQGIYQT